MNKKTIFLLAALLGVIAVFFLLRRNNGNTLTGNDHDFGFKSTDKIDKIFISNKLTGKYVILTKQDTATWLLNDTFNVNIHQVNSLLDVFKKLQIKRPVSNKEINIVKKDIAISGTKVEVYENGSLSKVYYVGNNTHDEMGTYFLMDKAEEPYVCHIPGFNGYIGAKYHYQPVAWRSKDIFRARDTEIKTLQVDWFAQAQNSFVINNEGATPVFSSNNKVFVNNKDINLNIVKSYLKLWENLSFEGFPVDLNAHKIDSIAKTTPLLTLTLTDKKGKITKLRIHKKGIKRDSNIQMDEQGNPLQFDIENFYAFINDNNKEVVQIQDYVFGKVMKTTADFILKP